MKTISARQLKITFIPTIIILVAILLTSVLFQVKITAMTKDVTAIAKIHPLSGILSNLGILLWCAAASICAFAAMNLYNVKQRDTFWFLLSSAFLSTYLLFDDFFQFHELLAPQYLGLNENVVFAALGIAVSIYLFTFKQIILQTNFGVLLLALGFLAASVAIDVIFEPWLYRLGQWEYFFEDGAKWLGIASWCSYYVDTSYQFLVSTPINSIAVDDHARASDSSFN